jgi:hypothetical protein
MQFIFDMACKNMKDTAANVNLTGEFVVHICDEAMANRAFAIRTRDAGRGALKRPAHKTAATVQI